MPRRPYTPEEIIGKLRQMVSGNPGPPRAGESSPRYLKGRPRPLEPRFCL
jgi:hypothetical protein